MSSAGPEASFGHLLAGRVAYVQPRRGFRTGIEPVLLAGSVPARAGETVVEAGTGAGAGLLCLLARVPGVIASAIESDPMMAEFARRNLDGVGSHQVLVEIADVAGWRGDGFFDHAFANPPWHRGGTASPEPGRVAAKQARAGLLHAWAASLGGCLRRRGTLSFVIPAALVAEAVGAFEAARCGEMTLIPLWPRRGTAAKLAILRGIKEGRGGTCLHPGLVLHEADGRLTDEVEEILRGGAALT